MTRSASRRGNASGRGEVRPRAAIQYDIARRSVAASRGSAPPSASALRVLAILTGLWIALLAPRCRPARGVHEAGCAHQANRLHYTLSALAEDAFGSSGGTQVQQVGRALEELGSVTGAFLVGFDETTQVRMHEVSHVLSLRNISIGERDGGLASRTNAVGYIAWDPFMFERLLAGRFQYIPPALVRGLRGETDFRVWVYLIGRPAVGRTRSGGYFEVNIGPGQTITPDLLGLGGQRPDKLRASIARALARGNALQTEWRAESSEAAAGQDVVKVRMYRCTHGTETARHPGTAGAASEDVLHGIRGRDARQTRTGNEHKRVPVDRIQERPLDSVHDTTGNRADIAALLARGWRGVTKAQRERLSQIADRHDGYEWAAEIIRDAPRGVDLLAAVFEEDSAWRTRREERARRGEAEWRRQKEPVRRRAGGRSPIGDIMSRLQFEQADGED